MSDATVLRAVQALGFDGLSELHRILAASLGAPDDTSADAMRSTLVDADAEPGHAVGLVLKTEREVLEALAGPDGRATLCAAGAALHPAQRILVFGTALWYRLHATSRCYSAALAGLRGR
ncbi:MurR/RpiR family transcriptional regulator [Dankookia rubra]|nr:hypothetical protein [Dankookia rubra]